MNYSNDSRNKIEKKQKNKQVKKKGKVTAFRVIVMTIIIGMFAVVGAGLGVFIGIIKSAPDARTIDLKPQGNYTSFVYDDKGNEIASFAPADNREYAPLSQIPLNLQHAVIAIEDERFYEHNGIDIKGIFRAIVTNLKSGRFSEGASTITQQLVKNNVLTTDKKITRKIQEQYLAIQFNELYDKDTILEYYLNTIGLSQGVSGVQAASKRYFGKDVSELSLTECVVIAGITQWPTRYDPIINPEKNWEKAQVILQKMEDQGYITAEEHAAALLENPYDNIQEVHDEFKSKSTRSYFVDALFTQLVADLQEKTGCTEADAKKKIYGGGLKIYATVNSDMQDIVDKYIDDDSQYPENLYKVQLDYSIAGKKSDGTDFEHHAQTVLDSNAEIESFKAKKREEWGITSEDTYTENELKQPQPQAAFILMDYTTGQIKALSGGRGDKTNLGFNNATQARRQPGSTFKVLASYAPALDLGILSPGSQLVNESVSYKLGDGSTWSPKNWDNNYSGSYTVREAIANSMNVLAVKTVDQIGIDTAFEYLQRFGFTTLSENDRVLSLPLGGISGVTPLELNAAYSAIANDGVYVEPVYYTIVEDKDGHVIIDNTGENISNHSHTVIKTSTARLLTDMMTEVVDGPSKHTGGTIRNYFTNMPVAGKTGTTTDSKDLLFSGYTPYYSATIWTGYAQPAPISSRNGGNSYHLKIWAKIMNEIHQNLEYKSFAKVSTESTGVSEIKICSLSKKRATALCEADPNHVVVNEFFTNSNAPTDYCNIHQEVEICTVSNKIATEYCPEETRKKVVITKEVINGTVQEDEICDIHVQETEGIPESPDITLPDENGNIDIEGTVPPTDIPTPTPTPGPSTTPTPEQTPNGDLPPTVDPSTPPSADDEEDFFIPQG